jgi:hypothetical protein
MPFTGSSVQLANLIVLNMAPLVNASDPTAMANLQSTANALATAIEAWILTAGANSVNSIVAVGIPVITAGSPTTQSGATTSVGTAIGSLL